MTRKKAFRLSGILLLVCMCMGLAVLAEKKRSRVAWDGGLYRLENVNPVDARFACPYNKTIDDAGTLLVVIANGSATLLVALLIFFKTKEKRDALRTIAFDAVTYAECYLFASSLYRILKVCVRRIRPYMYFLNPSEKGIAEGDFCLSWPSGHSSGAFMAFGFMFSWFLLRYPDSKAKKPALCIFFALGISTMILRMFSGNHFLTDVLSGATLGFFAASAVFQINNAIWKRS